MNEMVGAGNVLSNTLPPSKDGYRMTTVEINVEVSELYETCLNQYCAVSLELNCRVKPSLALAQLHQLPRTSPQKQQFITSPPS